MNKIFLVQLLLFATIIFTATSCATLTSGRSYVMTISSDLPNSEVIINHTNRYQLPSEVAITRSRENLSFKVLQDDVVVNDTILRARVSTAFWLGNIFFLYPIPFGHLIDLTNNNRFTYGRFMHVDAQGNVQRSNRFSERHFRQHQQGDFYILLALPCINFFHFNPRNETRRMSDGFLGVGIGIEYFYRHNQSLLLRGDAITNSLRIFPAHGSERFSTFNVSLTDNFHINRLQLGYGVNFAQNSWNKRGYWERDWWDESSVWIPCRRNVNNMLGMALSAHYRLTNHFHIGVIYRPSFIELSRIRPMYEHSISVDFMWRL